MGKSSLDPRTDGERRDVLVALLHIKETRRLLSSVERDLLALPAAAGLPRRTGHHARSAEWITVEQLAKARGISSNTAYKLLKGGAVPGAFKTSQGLMAHWRIPKGAVSVA